MNFSENPAVYVMVWKNIIDPDRPQKILYGIRTLHA